MRKIAQRRPARLKGVLRLCSVCELGGAQCVNRRIVGGDLWKTRRRFCSPFSVCSLAGPILTAVHDDRLTQRIGSYASPISSIPAALRIPVQAGWCDEVKAKVAPATKVIKVFRDARLLTFAFD